MLFIFSRLPGVGKSSLAKMLAAESGATYLRVDTLEQSLRDRCDVRVEGEGYQLAYRIAADNLTLGVSVVADSVNPIVLTRREWIEVADSVGAKHVNIEIVCSDLKDHQRRVEARKSDIPNLEPPTWSAVVARKFDSWNDDTISIDTAGKSLDQSYSTLRAAVLPLRERYC